LFPVTEKPNEAINFSGLPVSPNGAFGLYVRWIKGKVICLKGSLLFIFGTFLQPGLSTLQVTLLAL